MQLNMKTAFITTINTNIGDDFIRTGIENVIKSVKGTTPVSYTYVNKHFPETAIKGLDPIHKLRKLPDFKGKGRLTDYYFRFMRTYFNVFRNQELIIQSGAPVLWPDCHLSEWAQPIWYDIIGKLHNRIPVLNLAAGSCYPWERQEGFTNENEAHFARDIGSFCSLTTTRDRLANHLFQSAGVDNTLLPCTAFLVNQEFQNQEAGKYILINYMNAGGHFDWGQNIDAAAWLSTMKMVVADLSKNHEIMFMCHNEQEVTLARTHFPNHKFQFHASVDEYLDCIKNAKAGICNRMHASVAMASFGVPSISVCTDTRLLMLDLLKLPIFYVKEANSEQLLQTMNHLIDTAAAEKKRLFELKKETFEKYQELLRTYIR